MKIGRNGTMRHVVDRTTHDFILNNKVENFSSLANKVLHPTSLQDSVFAKPCLEFLSRFMIHWQKRQHASIFESVVGIQWISFMKYRFPAWPPIRFIASHGSQLFW